MEPYEGSQTTFTSPDNPNHQNDDLLRELFFSYIFHELRTPLTVIHSYAQILNARLPATPEFNSQKRVSEQIVSQGDELVEMIEELLEATRIPVGRLNLDLVEYDLVELLEGLIEHLPAEQQERLTWHPPARPVPVLAEGPRLERALGAVICFALQASPQVAMKLEQDPVRRLITLTLPTKGWNVSPAEAEHLFDLYRPVRNLQNSPAGTLKAGPLDISLFVAHGLIEGHQGRLTFNRAEPGFIITLPLAGGN